MFLLTGGPLETGYVAEWATWINKVYLLSFLCIEVVIYSKAIGCFICD